MTASALEAVKNVARRNAGFRKLDVERHGEVQKILPGALRMRREKLRAGEFTLKFRDDFRSYLKATGSNPGTDSYDYARKFHTEAFSHTLQCPAKYPP